jgi:type IV pilus assembly protein PilO
MFKRFSVPKFEWGNGKDPRALVRAVIGALLLANIAAALILFKPWGGSPEDLARQLESLRRQIQQKQVALQRSRSLVAKVETAREQGDAFLASYFAERRTAYYTLVSELVRTAQAAGIRPKEHSFAEEPVEGSDNLEMVTVVGNYEGNYGDLVRFINSLDRSPRFVILEQLNASPQQGSGLLTVNIKMHAFVKDTGAGPSDTPLEEAAGEEADPSAAPPPQPQPVQSAAPAQSPAPRAMPPVGVPPGIPVPSPGAVPPTVPRQVAAPNISRGLPVMRRQRSHETGNE